MIYLNYAGTSWPKPKIVHEAVDAVSRADPTTWPALYREAHQHVAGHFGVSGDRLLVTGSCTAALTLALSDHPWQSGDLVLTSCFEHHALYRNLLALQSRGVTLQPVPPTDTSPFDLADFELRLKQRDVRMVAVTAACNVTGQLLPFREITEIAHRYGALVLIDGAQIAGWMDLDLTDLAVDLFTFAGHKGPHGPWGVGGLYVSPAVAMETPAAVCRLDEQDGRACAPMPGFCDAGSLNVPALAGLAAALRWLADPPQATRLQDARALADALSSELRSRSQITLFGDVTSAEMRMPTVAFLVDGLTSDEVAARLRHHDILVSSGLQCSPQSHDALGTDKSGLVRVSFGPGSDQADVDALLRCLEEHGRHGVAIR